MKKLIALMLAAMTLSSEAQTPKVGSENDPIRQKLFACQSLTELLKGVNLNGQNGPLEQMAEAKFLQAQGRKNEAILTLKGVLGATNLETRMQLWTWTALRELGQEPDTNSAKEILGVVVEVPVESGYDTLAAYKDGSARYLNFAGRAIFGDVRDATIKKLCDDLISASAQVQSQATPRTNVSLPKSKVQVTLLTRAGMFVAQEPPEAIINAGVALMTEMLRRPEKPIPGGAVPAPAGK